MPFFIDPPGSSSTRLNFRVMISHNFNLDGEITQHHQCAAPFHPSVTDPNFVVLFRTLSNRAPESADQVDLLVPWRPSA